jgi:hypothetical protein
MKLLAAALLVVACGAPAVAASADFDPRSLAGTWSLSGSHEGDAACTVKFTTEGTIGGWVVKVPAACVRAFPKVREANAWTVYPDGAIGFADSMRHSLVKFEPVPDAYVSAEDARGVQLVLSKGGPAKPLSGGARMSGGWSVTGVGGEPRCSFTSKAAPSAKAGTLMMKPGCAAKWRSAGWASWKLTGGRLTLYDAKGKAIQAFQRGDVVTYEGEDTGGEPIYYSRD